MGSSHMFPSTSQSPSYPSIKSASLRALGWGLILFSGQPVKVRTPPSHAATPTISITSSWQTTAIQLALRQRHQRRILSTGRIDSIPQAGGTQATGVSSPCFFLKAALRGSLRSHNYPQRERYGSSSHERDSYYVWHWRG